MAVAIADRGTPSAIEAGFVEAGGLATFVRRRRGEGSPTVFIHGNPTDSAGWIPFLERMRGPALAPDLPASAAPSGRRPAASTPR